MLSYLNLKLQMNSADSEKVIELAPAIMVRICMYFAYYNNISLSGITFHKSVSSFYDHILKYRLFNLHLSPHYFR